MTNNNAQIYLVCGSGGVGKTTVAAALGLKFALEGKKTIVLTIDPAKRLATSLGLTSLTDEPKQIPLSSSPTSGEMWAMMLDTKRTFDRLVEKYASSPETRERIYNNKIYQHMSQMLAGTQEYMAMERLHEIYLKDLYDVIVVDTPPMQNALDFLAAPQKMHNMLSNSMLHILLKPTLSLGKSGLKFLEKSSQSILKIFDRITGFAFMQDISEMLIAFKDLLGGFESRAQEVNKLLSSKDAHFLAVCTTRQNSIQETKDFRDQLEIYNYTLSKVIINRVFDGEVFTNEKLRLAQNELERVFSEQDATLILENYKRFQPLIKRDQNLIREINKMVTKKNTTIIPLFFSDIHHLDGLMQIALSIENI